MPFSDPLADGPTIQRSNQKALDNGTTVDDCVKYVRSAREAGLTVPVCLMGYCNPFLSYGEEELIKDSSEAGISGFIVVDLPPDEAESFQAACDSRGMSLIPLVAPTTTEERMAKLGPLAKGYVYCVSVTGVTGARTELPPDLVDFCGRVRKHFQVPLAVGFGLSKHEHLKEVGKVAEGVVMGSAVIRAVSEGDDTAARMASLTKFVSEVVGGEAKS